MKLYSKSTLPFSGTNWATRTASRRRPTAVKLKTRACTTQGNLEVPIQMARLPTMLVRFRFTGEAAILPKVPDITRAAALRK